MFVIYLNISFKKLEKVFTKVSSLQIIYFTKQGIFNSFCELVVLLTGSILVDPKCFHRFRILKVDLGNNNDPVKEY